jgi:predicted regulator of Ras-like GTPase activity (Roadblock/LC7/MglB family)
VTTSNSSRLDWLLDDLVRRLAKVRYAVVLSTDGLLLGRSSSMTVEDAEHFSAMSSALQSLARSAGLRFDGGDMLQTVVELERAVLFVTSAGENACLALLSDEGASMGTVAYEMNQTVLRLGELLSTHKRRSLFEPQVGPLPS